MKTQCSSRIAATTDADFFARHLAAEQQSPESLLLNLRALLTRYAHERSPLVAGNIANCLNTLLVHPNFTVPSNERCTYRYMREYWLLVATLG